MPAPAPAICQEVVWKNHEVLAFAVALVKGALKKLGVGANQFTTDIVPDVSRGSGPGIAGSVVTMLQNASVIEPVGMFGGADGKTFYQHRVRSERPNAKSRYVNVYRLANAGAVEPTWEQEELIQ